MNKRKPDRRSNTPELINRVASRISNGSKSLPAKILVGNLSISKNDLASVGLLVANGDIGVILVETIPKGKGSKNESAAMYVAKGKKSGMENSIVLSRRALAGMSAAFITATMIHEACHAVFDMKKKTVGELEDEAIAYTTEVLYLLKIGSSVPQQSPWKQAIPVACDVIATGKVWNENLVELRKALISEGYKKLWKKNDGI